MSSDPEFDGVSPLTEAKSSRVLMVGAGGIGCELLKNLVLTGFGETHIVDLDTIDLSNLNRQFLFRQEHIKKSKALVAAEAAQKFNPNVKIVPYHANIKDPRFNVEWFSSFRIVFNALDNLEARRHVNKMCLAADVPLIESGTTGFNGQVQVIKKGVTACYDCTPKDTPKSFPVCTIRSTPSQPIHCIVWGKSYLLNEIFGTSEDESAFDHSIDADNAKEIEELKRESEALRKIRESVGTPEFNEALFQKVFHTDIVRLRSMEDMWKSRKPPEPLDYKALMEKASTLDKEAVIQDQQKIWTLEENLIVFNDGLDRLSKRVLESKAAGQDAVITFDKDDEDTLDFVAASANIRSTLFGIDRKSKFDTKQMAGNIIPAIATTNAIAAGLCVLEAFKVIKGQYSQAKEVFLTPFAPARLLGTDKSREPNPDCPVCGSFQVRARVDFSKATLNDFVEDFIKEELGYGEKEFAISTEVGIIYDPDETDNLEKKLSELSIKPDSFLTVTDEDNELVNVIVSLSESKEPLEEKPVRGILPSDTEVKIPTQPKKPLPLTNGAGSDGPLVVSLTKPTEAVTPAKRSHPGSDEGVAKKAKTTAADDDDDVVIVDDVPSGAGGDGGAIVIDDD
ncbi:putative ubiquitin-activating enzyme E1-like protein [Triangularia verruculosa]|uniref:Ubiquitin-activating enzyme E1-like n=1 Tax=Triangularia verruculosa TaxID=2587418 RepID=A0AAN6XSL7_9PEZI|nr:putative ubiquitin-activating enzyme E1-like protein [Triangularia verruculosa]